MSNTIWKTPAERPCQEQLVAWVDRNGMHAGRFDTCYNCFCACASYFVDLRKVKKWCSLENLEDLIAQADKAERLQKQLDTGDLSDGYHTFNELYYHRMCLFSIIVKQHKDLAWKSKLHSDGTMFDNYFIVGIDTPNGQATYHYHVDHWGMFDCVELPNAPEWDGHTADDVLKRLLSLTKSNN